MYNVLPYDFRYRQGCCALLIGGILCTALLLGCDSGTAPSIYDPNRTSFPDPVIEDVIPEDRALAGVDIVTITGQNFSTQTTDNLVYFGDARADVVEASSTQLRMVAPNSPQPELKLRLVVIGAENFSNSVSYGLDPPFIEFGDIRDFEDIYGITTDPSGYLYASLVAFSIPVGIIRISPDGERSEFISSTFFWADLAFGADDYLYAVRFVRAIFRFQGSGTNPEVFAVIPNNAVRLSTIAIDNSGQIWAAGDNAELYGISPDKTIRSYEFNADVQDIVLFGDFLYLAATENGNSKIWRFRIDSSGILGAPEEVFDMTSFNGATAFALAFSAAGHLFIGTDATDPVVVVDSDGVGQSLYPGVLTQPARRFAWGTQRQLYAATNSTETVAAGIIRITTRD
ncbi:MAG: IPT/TIG domain-containing protein [Bacteroidetes bacterium]|nr:IPT/TIG domain-containing protein [Bacteroidota bacterium]